jgi:uncharacterized membrane protein YsdA (DUF1294 family)
MMSTALLSIDDSTGSLIVASILLVLLLILNGYSFLLYRHDKKQAQADGWRVPERRLLLAALFGPFGAYAAMGRYRHKTRKLKFKLIPAFMVLWMVLIVAVIYYSF